MENQEKKDGQACCSTKCCGKAIAAIVLLALGGVGGYLAGKCCRATKCAVPAAAEAPATAK